MKYVILLTAGILLLAGCTSANQAINNQTTTTTGTCTESWTCTEWTACSQATNSQSRTCTDASNCGTTTSKPAITQSCILTSLYSSVDWNTLQSKFNYNSTNNQTEINNLIEPNKGKLINGTGVIQAIDKDIYDQYFILLRDPTNKYEIVYVKLFFEADKKDEVLALNANKKITFTCSIKDAPQNRGLELDKCALTSVEAWTEPTTESCSACPACDYC